MQHFRALDQDFLGLRDCRIGDAAIDGADRRALLLIEETNALGALVGDDIVDVLFDCRRSRAVQLPRRAALVDCGVGAFGLARAAIDAFFGNQRGHFFELRTLLSLKQIACYRELVRSSDNIGAHQVGQVRQHYSALASTTRRASSMNASALGSAGFPLTLGPPASPAPLPPAQTPSLPPLFPPPLRPTPPPPP